MYPVKFILHNVQRIRSVATEKKASLTENIQLMFPKLFPTKNITLGVKVAIKGKLLYIVEKSGA